MEETQSSQGLRRRELLVAGGAGALVLASPINYAAIARSNRLPMAKGGKFAHGVAAGFPSTKGITLWTRVSDITKSANLTLEVATDKNFNKIVDTQKVKADSKRDFTVHAQVKKLKAGEEYFYRFDTGDKSSKVGHFKTLPPADSKDKVRIAYFSCQDYEAGYYNVQAAIAKEKDLDLVICLGDYIYEHMYYPGPDDRKDTLGANKDGDVQTLAEYRTKYRMYQEDKNLQALHAAYPFVSIWDDHEVEDNYAGDTYDSAATDPNLENNNEYPRRVPFGERRANGYKAFFEAMPRLQKKGDPTGIYGSVKIGGLVELFLTDQRQYRDQQPCMDALLTACPDGDTPGRTMLGQPQKDWFKGAVAKSKATWKLWGSEVMVMNLDAGGSHVNQDQWDGYAAERKEILESFVSAGVDNLVVLTGDIHTFFAGNLTTTGGNGGTPIGVELVGGSATSLGIPEALGVPSSSLAALAAGDPWITYFDFDRRGYTVVEASKSELKAEYKMVDALTKGAKPTVGASFRVASGVPQLEVLSGKSRPAVGRPLSPAQLDKLSSTNL